MLMYTLQSKWHHKSIGMEQHSVFEEASVPTHACMNTSNGFTIHFAVDDTK